MRVFTPSEVSGEGRATNKYLSVLVAAKYARLLNEFPRERQPGEKKLTTRALEELASGEMAERYRVVPRRRGAE